MTILYKEDQDFNYEEMRKTTRALFNELEQSREVMGLLQPLLHALSLKLYPDNTDPVSIDKLVRDAVTMLTPQGE